MRLKKFLLLLFLPVLQGQVSFIPGLPGDTFCPPPVSPCRNSATCLYTDLSIPEPNTLLYGFGGFPFTCTIPVVSSLVDVVLGFYEPNKIATGQRVFNVSVNGGGALSIDLFSLAGLKRFTTVTIPNVAVVNGLVRISFTGVVGNAVISTIDLNAVPPPPPPPPPEINEKHVVIKPVAGQTDMTIPDATYVPESLSVIVNGLTMALGDDYTVTGTTVTLFRVSQAGDNVQFTYRFL